MSQPSAISPIPSKLRALLMPREHGSWSLALEPLALGLIAAPTWPGAAIAGGAVAMFLARRPWQAARAGDARAPLAATALLLLGAVTILALVFGVQQATGPAGTGLLAAVPAGAAFAWFDRRKAGRELAAELCGATFFAMFSAAIILAAGRDWPLAVAVAGFAFARSATSILAIRAFLRRRKGEAVARGPAVDVAVAAMIAFGLHAMLTGRWVPALWSGVFFVRTAWLLGPWAPAWPARRVGMTEALLGLAATISAGVAFR